MSNIHLVIECWGRRPSEIGIHAFTDHGTAVAAWERMIHEYLDGSDRDADVEINESRHSGVFHTGDGFISIVTETVDENVVGMSVDNPNSIGPQHLRL